MKLAVACSLGFACAGLLGRGDEPPPAMTVATVEVDRTIGGCNVDCQYRHRNQARKDSNVRGRTIKRQKRSLRTLVRQTPPWGNHWLEGAFGCIHAHEGRWSDPNPPYWGGLQFDSSFQRSYGPEFFRAFGTADRWPASVQIAVAIRAWLSRGFGPWPTRRYCGL